MALADDTLLHQLEHAMEHRLGKMLAPGPGVAQRTRQLQMEFLDAELAVGE